MCVSERFNVGGSLNLTVPLCVTKGYDAGYRGARGSGDGHSSGPQRRSPDRYTDRWRGSDGGAFREGRPKPHREDGRWRDGDIGTDSRAEVIVSSHLSLSRSSNRLIRRAGGASRMEGYDDRPAPRDREQRYGAPPEQERRVSVIRQPDSGYGREPRRGDIPSHGLPSIPLSLPPSLPACLPASLPPSCSRSLARSRPPSLPPCLPPSLSSLL